MRMMFDDASAVYDILNIASATICDKNGREVVFKVKENAISMVQVDPAHVSMARIDLKVEYEEDDSTICGAHITAAELKDGEFAVNLKLLCSAVKQFGKEPIIFDLTGDELILANPSTEIHLPLLDAENVAEAKEPNIRFSENLAIPYAILKKVGRMCNSSNSIEVKLHGSGLFFRTEFNVNDDTGRASWETTCWLPTPYPEILESHFPTSYIKAIASAIRVKPEGLIGVELGEDYPIRLTFREGACELRVLCAPRIEDNDDKKR